MQITLSEIRLSAFIVLVFSRQKGLTLVFRNDPLESLKVSSTFDSIPFVRDYLQKEIDGQLRILLMDQLPAIIHRLSLQLFVPGYQAEEDSELAKAKAISEEPAIDPFASPPLDPVDSSGNLVNPSEVASFSLDSSAETHSLFSQKNLLRLATLNDSHRTLSLFTPNIRDAVFRAWTGPSERGDHLNIHSPLPPALSRSHSYAASTATTYTFPDNASQSARSQFSTSGLSMGSARHTKPHSNRKRKKRVVNLRTKSTASTAGDGEAVANGVDTESYTTESVTDSTSSASVFSPAPPLAEESGGEDGEPVTPPQSPKISPKAKRPTPPPRTVSDNPQPSSPSLAPGFDPPPTRTRPQPPPHSKTTLDEPKHSFVDMDATPRASRILPNHPPEPTTQPQTSDTQAPLPSFLQFLDPTNSASIAEQAWMMKMANEMTRRYEMEKDHFKTTAAGAGEGASSTAKEGEEGVDAGEAPPAYAV